MKLVVPKIIGHRGACAYAPENTLTSMTKAHQLGVTWVEFDVMLAGCEEAIVIHDETLDRTTNFSGLVGKTPYSHIESLDAGSWFASEFALEKIPTFKEMLAHLASLNLGINVEIKPIPGQERKTVEKVLHCLESFWPKTCPAPLISSFSLEVIATVRKLDPQLALGFLLDSWEKDAIKTLKMYNCQSLHMNYKSLDREKVRYIKQKGYSLLAYTVNDPQTAQQLFEWGVDAVFSDVPDKLLK